MNLHAQYQLILASASPRRHELLKHLGIPFKILAPAVDESMYGNLSTAARCQQLAILKAKAALQKDALSSEGKMYLGADTLVDIAGKVLEKPTSMDEARQMLLQLSGREHQVITGVCLLYNDQEGQWLQDTFYAQSLVTFHPLSPKLLDYYLRSGDSLDKAGAYGIQSFGMCFIQKIVGTFSNVVGLPLDVIVQSLEKYSWPKDQHWTQVFV